MMRIWKSWVYTQLKSSYYRIRRGIWISENGVLQREVVDDVSSNFTVLMTITYDIYRRLGLDRDIKLIISQIEDIAWYTKWYGIEVYFLLLKDLLSIIRNEGPIHEIKDLNEMYPPGIVGAVMLPIIPLLKYRAEPDYFRAVHTYVNYMCKMSCDAPGLEERNIEEYKSFEKELSTRDVHTSPYSKLIQFIITDWFNDLMFEELRPDFSGGSTADAGRALSKKIVPSKVTVATSLQLIRDFRNVGLPLEDLVAYGLPGIEKAINKVQLVPKSALTKRVISMEPAAYNFWQNAYNKQLVRHMHRRLGKHINLFRQDLSAQLVVESSDTRSLATADLSAASDSITLDQVKFFFAEVPHVLNVLLAFRSTHAELPDGEILEMSKFAPMGSAFCFTIESVIFAACCEAACRIGNYPINKRRYRVYGDDIIIPTPLLNRLSNILASFGYKLNDIKTFSKGNFRESCGTFGYKGKDVTDPSLTRKNVNLWNLKRSASTLSMLCTTANSHYEVGCELTRYYYVCKAFEISESIPFVNDSMLLERNQDLPEYFLYTSTDTNFNVRRRTKTIVERQCLGKPVVINYDQKQVRVPSALRKYEESLSRYVMAEESLTVDDEPRYRLMLYAMAHRDRVEIVPSVFERLTVPWGELYLDSPIKNRWKSASAALL